MEDVFVQNRGQRMLAGFVTAVATVWLIELGKTYQDAYVFAGITGIFALLCIHPELRDLANSVSSSRQSDHANA